MICGLWRLIRFDFFCFVVSLAVAVTHNIRISGNSARRSPTQEKKIISECYLIFSRQSPEME